jgi:hypothetical protein
MPVHLYTPQASVPTIRRWHGKAVPCIQKGEKVASLTGNSCKETSELNIKKSWALKQCYSGARIATVFSLSL